MELKFKYSENKVGDKVKHNRITLEVKNAKLIKDVCAVCYFDKKSCENIICMSSGRKDSTDVYFEEIKE